MSGTEKYSSKVFDHKVLHKRMGREMIGQWVGPMKPTDFLDAFLPQADTVRPPFSGREFDEVVAAKTEWKMYQPFINAISPFAPTLKFVNTNAHKDMENGEMAVDVSAYRQGCSGAAITKTDFTQLEIPLEFKHKVKEDPFVDSYNKKARRTRRYPFEKTTVAALQTCGQVASYSSALAGAQFRIHSFSVLIFGGMARLIRWDRSGAIVTKRFSYAKADHLAEFFWRYSQLPDNDSRRGHDPTVSPLAEGHIISEEEKEARSRMIEANKTNHREFRLMTMPDRDTNEDFEFIISYPPSYTRHSPIGRATRPMLAFDILDKKLVFAKDYWRPHDVYSDKEGDIHRLLEQSNVNYVATFWKGNDIREHMTVTDSLKSAPWAHHSSKTVSLRHYRMSLEQVGRPLNRFKTTYELVTAIADAMEAHEMARHDAKVLHRDISSGNIIITDSGHGLLIDWDLCLRLDRDEDVKARRPERTGTWQFMSIAILRDPKRRQDHLDDRESSFHVLTWNLLRYTLHNKLDVLYHKLRMFDEVSDTGETGGDLKFTFLYNLEEMVFLNHPILNKLVQELGNTFLVPYEKPLSKGLTAYYKSEAAAHDTTNPFIRRKNLEDRWWLVNTMRKYLNDKSQWPKSDAAHLNPVISPAETTQRIARHQGKIAGSIVTGSRKRYRKAVYSSSDSEGSFPSELSDEDADYEEGTDDDDIDSELEENEDDHMDVST